MSRMFLSHHNSQPQANLTTLALSCALSFDLDYSQVNRDGWSRTRRYFCPSLLTAAASPPNRSAGGKAKPLKQPKKDKKEMDEDEVAFKAKQAAGTCLPAYRHTPVSVVNKVDKTPKLAKKWPTRRRAKVP